MGTVADQNNRPAPREPHNRLWLGFCLLLAVAVFFLWEEHSAHILGAVPYVLLLACPLIHLFMHRGHGERRSDASHGGHHNRKGGHI